MDAFEPDGFPLNPDLKYECSIFGFDNYGIQMTTRFTTGSELVREAWGPRQGIEGVCAFFKDPAVVVIDEDTSALDMTIKSEFMKIVRLVQDSRRGFIFANRRSTAQNCGRLYNVEKGLSVENEAPEGARVQVRQKLS